MKKKDNMKIKSRYVLAISGIMILISLFFANYMSNSPFYNLEGHGVIVIPIFALGISAIFFILEIAEIYKKKIKLS